MKKTGTSIIAVILVMALVLAGCSSGQESTSGESNTEAPDQKDPNIAIIAYNSEPVLDWDPSSGSSNETIVFHNVYETLTRYNATTLEIDPLIAESYEASEDGLTWTFVIRQGMKFHDGTDVNAEAVKFSIDRTRDINMGSAYVWDAVDTIEVVDEYTVQFNLAYPTPLQYVASSGYAAFIMSPTAIEANGEDWLKEGNDAGSGPYVVAKSTMGEEVVLQAFPEYWGGWTEGQYDTVVIKKISETSSRRQLVESGEVTAAYELPAEDVEALSTNDGVNIVQAKTFTNLLFQLNTQVEPLNNVKVRQALSYAFPYEDVLLYAAGGYGSKPRGVIPEGIVGHSDEVPQYTFDLDKAKELLVEAGHPDGGFELDLHYLSGDELQKKTAELYKSELGKIGVTLNIRSMPWDSYYDVALSPNPEDRQDIFALYWWPDNALPASWFYMLYYTEEMISWNMSYYSDPAYDALIDEAEGLVYSDIESAEKLYIEANTKIVDEALSLYALDMDRQYVTNASMEGLIPNPAYDTVIFFYDCRKVQ